MYRVLLFLLLFLTIPSCKTAVDSDENNEGASRGNRGVWHGTVSSDNRAIGIYQVGSAESRTDSCKRPKVPLEVVCTAVAACPNMLVTIGHCIEDTKEGIESKLSGFTTSAIISTKEDPKCAIAPPSQYHWTDKGDDKKNPRTVYYPNPDDPSAKDGITAVYLDTPLPAGTPFAEFEGYEFKKDDKGIIVGYGENGLKGWTGDPDISWYERRSGEQIWQSSNGHYATFGRGGDEDNPTAAMGGDSGGPFIMDKKVRGIVKGGRTIGKNIPIVTYIYLFTPDVLKMIAQAKKDFCPAEAAALPTETNTAPASGSGPSAPPSQSPTVPPSDFPSTTPSTGISSNPGIISRTPNIIPNGDPTTGVRPLPTTNTSNLLNIRDQIPMPK